VTQAPAGWHPDPGGAAQWRYWDGTAWTEHVSPYYAHAHAAAAATPAEPAAPATPRRKMSRGLLAAIIGASLLALGGCGALAVVGINRGVDEAKKEANRHALTPEEFDSVRPGETRVSVERRLRRAESVRQRGAFECLYYFKRDHILRTRYKLCFSPASGRLAYKES
jgi:hypothetical protein